MSPVTLQKQMSGKYKRRVYVKYVIVIPNDLVEKLGWKPGEELTDEVRGKTLILKPAT